MTRKPVWANSIERDAWVERHCRVCFQPDEALRRITGDGPGCPHLARAEQNKPPTPWTRRRNAVMGETYRCSEFQKRPAVNRRGKADVEVEPMLEVEPVDRALVPVDGWPDWRAEQRKGKEGDHQ
jgi:putative SOS response-associated peptidase YedK